MNWPARAKGQTPDITGRPDEPWWTRQAITWMDEYLTKDMNVVEWGAGSSTLWLAQRVGYVTTMEHDDKWSDFVSKALREANMPDRWQLLGRPLCSLYVSEAIAYAVKRGEVNAVIVDGRMRVNCCERAMNVLMPGGILLLDNAERKEYAKARALLSRWPVIETNNGIWHTNIWIKPNA